MLLVSATTESSWYWVQNLSSVGCLARRLAGIGFKISVVWDVWPRCTGRLPGERVSIGVVLSCCVGCRAGKCLLVWSFCPVVVLTTVPMLCFFQPELMVVKMSESCGRAVLGIDGGVAMVAGGFKARYTLTAFYR